ncbi:MAG: ParA family protein [Deltaproteobacteria bacterium]|nr:ParA family protein [Deltaproteobacteria bacterium]
MTKTITLCSGKGGVGKTVLASSLARIIQQEEHANVLLLDLDPSVQGLTLLLFQNKYELDHVPLSFAEYLAGGEAVEKDLLEALHKSVNSDGHAGPLYALYRRAEGVFAVPFSTESERPDWTQFSQLDFDVVSAKLQKLIEAATDALKLDYVIIDTQAGPGSLIFAAATLSDVNLILLEEDDISWRTALNLLVEISDLNKRLQRRSRSYFLANKASAELVDTAGKLKAFSFLSPLPYDAWMQKLFAKATSAVLEKEFENTDFFRQVRTRVWHDIAGLFGMSKQPVKDSFKFGALFRRQNGKSAHHPIIETNGVAPSSTEAKANKEATVNPPKEATPDKAQEKTDKPQTPQGNAQPPPPPQKSSGNAREGKR